MSDIVAEFDPSTDTSTSFTVPSGAANGALVFWNESNISLNLTFQDGTTLYLPAWYNRHKCGASGSVNIKWDIRTVLSSASPPTSEIIVESYEQGEHFPADGPLVRQANVGNTVSTVGGTASTIQNDGNAINTTVVEATVAGDGASAVKLLNNGQLSLGDASYIGFLNMLSNLAGQIVLGNAKLSNSLNLTLQVGGGHTLYMQVGAFPVASIDPNGINLLSGKLNLPNGAISGISSFGPYAVSTVTTAYNHNLGVVPDLVLLQVQGGVSTIRTCVYDPVSMTNTQVSLTGSGSFNVVGLALKF